MKTTERQVVYYETSTGKQPFRAWFHALKDREARNRIDVRIRRVSLGNLGYCHSVGGGVVELKIDYGPGYRVYFGIMGNRLVVLLLAGDKKTQQKDIKLAIEYWKEYRRRDESI